MLLSELIAKHGDEDIEFQVLDQATESITPCVNGTLISFATDESFVGLRTVKLGLVVWLDRARTRGLLTADIQTESKAIAKNKAVHDVIAERLRQINKGYTVERDDQYPRGELALAGAAYAGCAAAIAQDLGSLAQKAVDLYPWSMMGFQRRKNLRAALVRAAALILAEIEKIDRDEARKAGA